MQSQESPHFPNSFYRVTVKGLCVRDGKLLLMRESEALSGAKWELPGGGLDFGETPESGLVREVKEETGLSLKAISKRPLYVWTYKFTEWRQMDWFYALVLCYRVEFESLDFTLSDECEEIAFFSKEELATIPLGRQLKEMLPGTFDLADFTGEIDI